MKRCKFTVRHTAFAWEQTSSAPREGIGRKLGLMEATFYNLKKKYGKLAPAEVRRLR